MNPCKLFHVFDGKDRITDLDENLLSHILSRLPTTDVVQTSILSTAWRYKWTTSYNMFVDDDHKNWPCKKILFVNFMNRILKYSLPQRSICLWISTIRILHPIQAWISSALTHRLEVLELRCRARGIVIPCSLLNSTCLQEVKLELCESTLNVAAVNYAPNLTSLFIMGVNIVNENHSASTTMKFNFPLLETFTLGNFKWLNVKFVELNAPSLTTFISEPSNGRVEYDYSVVILAPRLATFECGLGIPEKFVMDGSSIVSAHFECDNEILVNLELLTNIGIRVRNLLNDFKNLEELFLVEVSQFGPPLQCHDKLRKLTFPCEINVEYLFEILHAAPSLKILSLCVDNRLEYDYEAMGPVPACITSHLEEVELYDYNPNYDFLKFLFMNGEKLKKLTMSQLIDKQRNEVKEFVSAFRNVELISFC